ncbi:hypothetical protein MTsPCn9_24900 [Croceitalea sp. MTPC9]|uniref:lipocalin family protein n=1 Tax=unclassified Croceitalea TaxID=2632280 RepID=UPI002B3CC0CD|nr:hypothetical protein MTsPCn6_29630 [Croceitalea sp. MTPC6]GMN17552.1 hypothetical protein MTsPCn9_24900 [Croceitalea sp. MTPC9]
MKKGITAIIALLFLASCSTDNENDGMLEASALVGTWNMTDVRFEEDPNDTSLNLADEIVDQLVEESCFLVSFTFNADGTATADNKVNYIEVNAGPTGLDVPCPNQSDVETTTWSLVGNQLTFINEDLEEETITVQLEGNTLILAGDDINAENYTGTEVVFTRQ